MNVRVCSASLLILVSAYVCDAGEPATISLEVTETAGVHRDHAPVHVLLTLPQAVPVDTPFRLSHQDRDIVAQFRPHEAGSVASQWWLDFLAETKPLEQRTYTVEFGDGVEAVPERTTGHVLEATEDAFVISNEPYISWTVPRDLEVLLSSVNFPPSEHLRAGASGLTLVDRDGRVHRLGGAGLESRVVREGRMAVALQFEKKETDAALSGVHWTLDLTFPGPISWVDVQLTIDDPRKRIAEARLNLNLNLDPPDASRRTIVELGADRTVYRSLFGESQVVLQSSAGAVPAWQVLRSTPGGLQPFVLATPQSSEAEGWAHVMDRQRCLAIAVDQFGRQGPEQLSVTADGKLTVARRFTRERPADGASLRHWRMWMHFVHFPPQQSAATDPQMMQNPLTVRQQDARDSGGESVE